MLGLSMQYMCNRIDTNFNMDKKLSDIYLIKYLDIYVTPRYIKGY